MKTTKAIIVILLAFSSLCYAGDDKKHSGSKDKRIVSIELDGMNMGEFKLVQGPSMKSEIISYQDGEETILKKRPGKPGYGNIVISRRINDDMSLRDWYLAVHAGSVERKQGAIMVWNKEGDLVDRYDFSGAWPSEWQGGVQETVTLVVDYVSFATLKDAVAVEEVEQYTDEAPACEPNEEEIVGEPSEEEIAVEPSVEEPSEEVIAPELTEEKAIDEEPSEDIISEDLSDSHPSEEDNKADETVVTETVVSEDLADDTALNSDSEEVEKDNEKDI